MNFKQLKAFLSLAERGSVTATAEYLSVTQSGVSRQIATLEEELGFLLFDRVRGRLVINRRGQAFTRHVRQTVDQVDLLPRAARAIADGVFDRVSVVATSSIIHGLLPGAIARYIAKRPGLPPRVIMRSLREITELRPEDDFDLLVAPMPIPLSRFRLVETIEFELRLAGPSTLIPFSEEAVDLGQLGNLPFISLDPFATYQESIEAILGAAGIDVTYVCETSSVVTAAQLVRLGVGCAFLDPFIASAVRGPGIHIVRLRESLTHAYGVYAPVSGLRSDEAQQFLDTVREHISATRDSDP
jgi:DNA-binding transcriptional LysR family regulator